MPRCTSTRRSRIADDESPGHQAHVISRLRIPQPPASESRSWFDLALVGLLVVSLGVGLLVVLSNGALGHDESVYALKARSWFAGTPTTGWGIHRPFGMPVIGWVVLQISDADITLRITAIVLSMGSALAMWFTGRVVFDRWTATLSVGVFLASTVFLRRATEFLNDLTAASFLVLTMLVIWYHFEKKPTGWWLLAAAPLGAAAYYMRYASAVPLAVMAVVAALAWHRPLLRSWRSIAGTAGLFLVLMVPHAMYSIGETGTVLGVLGSHPAIGSFGLTTFIKWLPVRLAGISGGVLIVAAGAYAVYTIAAYLHDRSNGGEEVRKTVFFIGTAVAVTVALGLTVHAEQRFLYLPLMAVLFVGMRAAVRLAGAVDTTPRQLIFTFAAMFIIITFVRNVPIVADRMDGLTNAKVIIVDASDAVVKDTGGGDCWIRSTFVPQLTWYTRCSTHLFSPKIPSEDPLYLVVFENGKRQPTGPDLAAEIEAAETLVASIDDAEDKIGDALVYRYSPDR